MGDIDILKSVDHYSSRGPHLAAAPVRYPLGPDDHGKDLPGDTALKLGTKILIGVLCGVACGILLGEWNAPLKTVGDIYVGLLQMTVLPYVTVSLMAKIGGLSKVQATRLAGRAGVVMLLLWCIALLTVLVMPFSLPASDAGTFFSASLVDRSQEFSFLELYLPVNPFHSLANNIVPATVLFSILIGVALIGVPNRQRIIEPLEVLGKSLSRITMWVVALSPWGTFALTAGAAGTMEPAELARLTGYVSTFTLAVLFLALVVLPGFVATVTPLRMRHLLGGFRDAGLTAFATGKLFAVLPMIIDDSRRLLIRQGVKPEEAEANADVFVPLGFAFPDSGKLLGLLYIPFAAWFVGRPLGPDDYPLLLTVGLLSLFGSPVVAIPFLLDLLRLPADLFPLFLVAGIWCARLGQVLGTMHLMCFTLLCSASNGGWLKLRLGKVAEWAVGVTLGGTILAVGNHFIVRQSIAGQAPTASRVAAMELTTRLVAIEEGDPGPNPLPLARGETRLDRIRRTGELRVGYATERPPFCYRNGKGDLVGLDVDLIGRFAATLDVSMRLAPSDPRKINTELAADFYDIAIGGIPSSIDNLGSYAESVPYLDLHIALLTPDYRAKEFQTLEQIRRTEGVRFGYVSAGHLAVTGRHRLPGVEIVQIPSIEAYLAGETPDIDALITTAETGSVLSMLHPDFSVVVPRGARARVPVVFAVDEEGNLERLLDRWIRLAAQDGTIDELYAHWVLGEQAKGRTHRWSVARDVFGWGG